MQHNVKIYYITLRYLFYLVIGRCIKAGTQLKPLLAQHNRLHHVKSNNHYSY